MWAYPGTAHTLAAAPKLTDMFKLKTSSDPLAALARGKWSMVKESG